MLDTTEDYSANTNTLTELSAPPTVASIIETVEASARSFDGAADGMFAADHATLDLGDAWTLEAWVVPRVAPAGSSILNKVNAYQLFATSTFWSISNSTTSDIVRSRSPLPVGDVSHIVGTKSGTTVFLYRNGIDVTGAVVDTTATVNTAFDLHIGERNNTNEWFDGKIQAAAVYPTALSAARVQAHYVAGKCFRSSFARFPKPKLVRA